MDAKPAADSTRAAGRACAANARCAWCGRPSRPVAVHGHVQCGHCGLNVDPCCGGETAQGEGANGSEAAPA